MSKERKIKSVSKGEVTLTCFYDFDWKEYHVCLYRNGVYQGNEHTYYTKNRQDALDTMNAMLNNINAD